MPLMSLSELLTVFPAHFLIFNLFSTQKPDWLSQSITQTCYDTLRHAVTLTECLHCDSGQYLCGSQWMFAAWMHEHPEHPPLVLLQLPAAHPPNKAQRRTQLTSQPSATQHHPPANLTSLSSHRDFYGPHTHIPHLSLAHAACSPGNDPPFTSSFKILSFQGSPHGIFPMTPCQLKLYALNAFWL